jgi:hypothetical protein
MDSIRSDSFGFALAEACAFFVFRNFDILAAVFTDVLKFMHDDDMEATAS